MFKMRKLYNDAICENKKWGRVDGFLYSTEITPSQNGTCRAHLNVSSEASRFSRDEDTYYKYGLTFDSEIVVMKGVAHVVTFTLSKEQSLELLKKIAKIYSPNTIVL